VDRPDLLVLNQTDCLSEGHQVSEEEDELFDLGRDLGADIVGYYIQGDAAGFRRALRWCLEAPGRLTRMKQASKSMADRYDIRHVAESYETLFVEAAGSRRASLDV
jgi:hypothetical protein